VNEGVDSVIGFCGWSWNL